MVGIKNPEAGRFPGNRLEQDHGSRGSTPIVKFWGAAVLLHALTITTGQVSSQTAVVVNDVVWTVASIFAGVSSFRAAKLSAGAERAGWVMFTLACAAWAAGQPDPPRFQLRAAAPAGE